MKLLLDTHIFLWYIGADKKLPSSFLEEIRNPENEVYLSTISLWEIIIKNQIGRTASAFYSFRKTAAFY